MFKRGDTSTVKLAIGLAIVAAVILMFLPFIKNLTNLAGDKQTSQAQATLDHFSTEIQNLVDASYNYQEIALSLNPSQSLVAFDNDNRKVRFVREPNSIFNRDITKPTKCAGQACVCLFEDNDFDDNDLFDCKTIAYAGDLGILGINDDHFFTLRLYNKHPYNVGNDINRAFNSVLPESLVFVGYTDFGTDFTPDTAPGRFEFKTRYLSMRKFESEGKLYVIVADSAFADMMRRIK